MTKRCALYLPNYFARGNTESFTYETILRDRFPCALSKITLLSEGSEAGNVAFYSTPMGTVVESFFSLLPYFGSDYEPCYMEIEEKRNSRYKNVTANLPPVFTVKGEGRGLFITDRFSAADVVGKRIAIKKNGSTIAFGTVSMADECRKQNW